MFIPDFLVLLTIALLWGCCIWLFRQKNHLSQSLNKRESAVGALQSHNLRVSSNFNLLNTWLEKRNQGKKMSQYFKSRELKHIGIYGLGSLGERCIEELMNENVSVSFIVDNRFEFQGGRYDGIPVINPQLLNKYTEPSLLVVTPTYAFDSIKAEMEKHNPKMKFKSLDQIIQDL